MNRPTRTDQRAARRALFGQTLKIAFALLIATPARR